MRSRYLYGVQELQDTCADAGAVEYTVDTADDWDPMQPQPRVVTLRSIQQAYAAGAKLNFTLDELLEANPHIYGPDTPLPEHTRYWIPPCTSKPPVPPKPEVGIVHACVVSYACVGVADFAYQDTGRAPLSTLKSSRLFGAC